ncbi:hypothetical protein HMPREF1860_01327 [Prevotella amnii]|uniref:Phospholipase D-like domain-containing protein n=1 Tax=Prevotella amnii TaxID=419005 RepID=A0A134BC47_9BACT|nr:hypothetical protein [Prevotella amnii]KXB77533.1 hypothetical protein HMPREF1860_01327 [Prevotella amnii]
MNSKTTNHDILGDIGNFDLPDVDINLLDFVPADEVEETRYTLPKVTAMKSDYICYDNAKKLAKDLRLDKGQRSEVFVSGAFIFGDFIEAYLTTHHVKAVKMTITTLSMSQENVDSLRTLLEFGYIDELNLVISVYFWGNERAGLIPYIYKELDYQNKFQLAVASIHTKTITFETLGGRKMVIHGSANLRSSGNIEQFTIEENSELYRFYNEHFDKIIDKYATIRKPIRGANAWEIFTRKYFND